MISDSFSPEEVSSSNSQNCLASFYEQKPILILPLQFPNFLGMMAKKFDEVNAEDEIREAFKVFDSVSIQYRIRFVDPGIMICFCRILDTTWLFTIVKC